MPGNSPADTLNATDYQRPLLAAVLDAMARQGASYVIAADITRATLTYRQLFMRAFILAQKIPLPLREGVRGRGTPRELFSEAHPPPQPSPSRGEEEYVGVLLPTANAALLTFIALHIRGAIPCMLNFSSGASNVLHACRIARVKTVLTSRAFIEKGKFEPLVEAIAKEHEVIYLEDLRSSITLLDKLSGALKGLTPRLALKRTLARVRPHDPAVILYTSGSEGAPKGVALSHANILANIAQVNLRLALPPSDIVFNALPVFHSFGLTVGMLMPLVRGIKTVLYPSPVQYKAIPGEIKISGATIMLGTDTFYNGYARYGEREDFAGLRLAVAGAEKLRDATRECWLERFGVDILQGYGVTEASPVISVNIPGEHKPGTVGRLFPGMGSRIEPVAGLEKGGRLVVRGHNVMLGYLKADKPGVIQPQGEWYDTGDIVEIDADGYISIQGRAKRFAKIAGEMVSLQAVEDLACGLLPDVAHAAIAMPDERKGEQIILFTESRELTKEQLHAYARAQGVAEIALPKQVHFMEAIPRLGNGKIDYMTLQKSSR